MTQQTATTLQKVLIGVLASLTASLIIGLFIFYQSVIIQQQINSDFREVQKEANITNGREHKAIKYDISNYHDKDITKIENQLNVISEDVKTILREKK